MNSDCKWLQETNDGVVLTVKAVPRAAKSIVARRILDVILNGMTPKEKLK